MNWLLFETLYENSMFKKILVISIPILLFTMYPSFAQEDEQLVVLHTKSGDLIIEFFYDDAPNHVENFIELTESGFYDRTIFHRIIKDFMIQGGDPKTKPGGYGTISEWGTGDPGYSIQAEFNDIKHNRGIVSMARSTDPNSAGSQFFIVHKDSNHLDGQYTIFGRLITQESFDTLDTLANLEVISGGSIAMKWGDGEILSAEVVNRSEISDLLDLGEPERTTVTPPETFDEKYVNEELGISFTTPEGWQIQEPPKTSKTTPIVVVVGPSIGGFNPAFSISIIDSDGISLEEHMVVTKNRLQDSIDKGQFEILSEEDTSISGNKVSILNVRGIFITDTGSFNLKFKEVTISTSDKFFKLTYTNTENNFDNYSSEFDQTLDSFTILSENPDNINSNNEENGGGCLIATATFGSELASQVQQLRELRDNTLLQTVSGTAFMTGFNQLYYSFSPTIADWERVSPIFKEVVKTSITPLLTSLSILKHVSMDSEVEVIGYGLSIILINTGFYIVLPAIIIKRIIGKKIYQTSST